MFEQAQHARWASSAVPIRETIGSIRRPAVSIVLPQYGRVNRLDRFFNHHVKMLDGTGLSYEILVSDDASPDETESVVARWAETCKAIRYVRQEKNTGFRQNFLYCLRQARGEFTIYVGNDDLLIDETLVRYVRRLSSEPDVVMIQAPWFLLNEHDDNKITGVSYSFPEEMRFFRGEQGRCLDFVIRHHVFPEWFIVRTDAVPGMIGPFDRSAYHFFVHLAHALELGDVLFAPEPYAIVTAISRGGDVHVGNTETLHGWDEYRGGLEYMASFARQRDASWSRRNPDLVQRIQEFTNVRMSVALRLHLDARNWLTAWHLSRRLMGQGLDPLASPVKAELATLAAMDACLIEAGRQGFHTIAATTSSFAIMREVLNIGDEVTLVCADDVDDWEGVALIVIDGDVVAHEAAMVVDLSAAIRRFRP